MAKKFKMVVDTEIEYYYDSVLKSGTIKWIAACQKFCTVAKDGDECFVEIANIKGEKKT